MTRLTPEFIGLASPRSYKYGAKFGMTPHCATCDVREAGSLNCCAYGAQEFVRAAQSTLSATCRNHPFGGVTAAGCGLWGVGGDENVHANLRKGATDGQGSGGSVPCRGVGAVQCGARRGRGDCAPVCRQPRGRRPAVCPHGLVTSACCRDAPCAALAGVACRTASLHAGWRPLCLLPHPPPAPRLT